MISFRSMRNKKAVQPDPRRVIRRFIRLLERKLALQARRTTREKA
jgi:hypothetical protein